MITGGGTNLAAKWVICNGREVGLVSGEDGGGFDGVLWRRWRGSIVLHSIFVSNGRRSISSGYNQHLPLPTLLQLFFNLIILPTYPLLGPGADCILMLVMWSLYPVAFWTRKLREGEGLSQSLIPPDHLPMARRMLVLPIGVQL